MPFPVTKRDFYDPYHVDDEFDDLEEGGIITHKELTMPKQVHSAAGSPIGLTNSSPGDRQTMPSTSPDGLDEEYDIG